MTRVWPRRREHATAGPRQGPRATPDTAHRPLACARASLTSRAPRLQPVAPTRRRSSPSDTSPPRLTELGTALPPTARPAVRCHQHRDYSAPSASTLFVPDHHRTKPPLSLKSFHPIGLIATGFRCPISLRHSVFVIYSQSLWVPYGSRSPGRRYRPDAASTPGKSAWPTAAGADLATTRIHRDSRRYSSCAHTDSSAAGHSEWSTSW